MGLVATLFKWLKTSSRKLSHDDQDLTKPIDIPQVIKDLKLIEAARALGNAGQPHATVTAASGPEVEILHLVESKRKEFVTQGFRRSSILNQSLAMNDVTREVNAALDADKEFGQKAGALLTAKASTLKASGDVVKARNDELAAFKIRNNLQREAVYPSGWDWGIKAALLVALVLLEGLLNAFFFAQGLDSGLIGGAMTAFTVAAINVLVAFCIGFFLVRYRVHVHPLKRTAGWLGIGIALVWLLTAGLGIGHIRDALTAGSEAPYNVALEQLKTNPTGLVDMQSWGLFVISFFAGTFAVVDAHLLNDSYPGYGAVTRAARKASEDYETELTEVREDLEELKEEQLTLLEKVALSAQTSLATYASTIDAKKTAQSRLDGDLTETAVALQALLSRFRTENTFQRRGEPTPAYFENPMPLQDLVLPNFGTERDYLHLGEQREKLNQLVAQTQELSARIQNAFNESFDQLQPLKTHFSLEA